MNNWRVLLRNADPLAGDAHAQMSGADAVRRAVVCAAAVGHAPAGGHVFRAALAMAGTIAVTVWVGVFTGSRLGEPERRDAAGAPAPAHAPGQVRQLQFSTPGGTRIIWIFNPDLNLNETTP